MPDVFFKAFLNYPFFPVVFQKTTESAFGPFPFVSDSRIITLLHLDAAHCMTLSASSMALELFCHLAVKMIPMSEQPAANQVYNGDVTIVMFFQGVEWLWF